MKTKRVLNFSFPLLFVLFMGIPCSLYAAAFFTKEKEVFLQQKDTITWRIVSRLDKTYGYDIFQNGKLLIHQPAIPGREGNKGFRSAADAQKVALLVVAKIKNGIMPPAVTQQEMKELGIADR